MANDRRVLVVHTAGDEVEGEARIARAVALVGFERLPRPGVQLVQLRRHVRHRERPRAALGRGVSVAERTEVPAVVATVRKIVRRSSVDAGRKPFIGVERVLAMRMSQIGSLELPRHPVRRVPPRVVRDDEVSFVDDGVVRGIGVRGNSESDLDVLGAGGRAPPRWLGRAPPLRVARTSRE
jgi:hypothetical protein